MLKKNLLTSALAFALTLGLASAANATTGAMSNYLTNKLFDFLIRGQSYTPPATVYVALATSAGSPAACGTEVSGGGYTREAVTSSLANWAGTQGAGTTAVSSGTNSGSGLTISNNAAITFPGPSASWGTVVEFCVYDSVNSGGSNNLLFRASLTSPQTVNSGAQAPSFAAGALTWTLN